MAFLPCRPDSRLFSFIFVLFNVLLAIFNIFSYQVSFQKPVPCVVIVGPTQAPIGSDSQEGVYLPLNLTQVQVPPSQEGTTTKHSEGVVPHISWSTEVRDKYVVINRYVPSQGKALSLENSVTLTTQGTYEFLHHAENLCKRWEGPVSVAVYAPGTDLPVALRKIFYLQQCGHPCVRENITWHAVYERPYGPSPDAIKHPITEANISSINCTAGMDALELNSHFRKAKKLPYPINVARNVARSQAATKYVLASDIELYPSANIIPRFLRLIQESSQSTPQAAPHVYVLPIFEVKVGFDPPETKADLVALMSKGQAIFFHKWVCDPCQHFPRRDAWVKNVPKEDSLQVFEVTKRQRPLTAWEPIYIGTNAEPLYEERLSWEGKRDKMSQMYELCLMNYDFNILDNAFLVHAPGIKTINAKEERKRAPYIHKNNALFGRLLQDIRKKHGERQGC